VTPARRLTVALAAASVAGAAYVQWGHAVLLGLASTSLALAGFWLAEPRRDDSRVR
jgi:hypothetical protein